VTTRLLTHAARPGCTSAAGCEPARAAHHPGRGLETRPGKRAAHAADTGAARRDHRAAIFSVVDDESAGAGLVLAILSHAVPYRLFALSNFASLLALLSYPVRSSVSSACGAVVLWSIAYVGFAVLCGVTAYQSTRGPAAAPAAAEQTGLSPEAPPTPTAPLWIALSATAPAAACGHQPLTQNIASIPFLWWSRFRSTRHLHPVLRPPAGIAAACSSCWRPRCCRRWLVQQFARAVDRAPLYARDCSCAACSATASSRCSSRGRATSPRSI